MESKEALQWLKKNNLFTECERSAVFLKKIFIPCLGIRDEKILIIGDKGEKGRDISAILSGGYYLAAKAMNINAKLVIQEKKKKGSIADNDVIESLGSLEENNVVFINTSNTLGSIKELGKSFRKLCHKKGYRFVSTPGLGNLERSKIDYILNAINVDYRLLQVKHRKLKEQLDDAKEIQLKTPAGTDLSFNVEGTSAISADGNYITPGSGGNLPAGEVYIPPNGKKVEGKFVIDVSSRNRERTVIVKEPITLTIEEGSITNIEGGDEAKELNETLDWAASVSKHPASVRRIGELGIGLNPNAKVVGATIIDEKALGTAHIGIGSNYWFGGSIYAKIHLDQICAAPEILLDGVKLVI